MPTIKVRAGRFLMPLELEDNGKRIIVRFKYNKKLLEIIKTFEGRRWHPDDKYWSIANTSRNQFQLAYLQWQANKALPNPYERYDYYLDGISEGRSDFIPSERPLYDHQLDMVVHGLAVRQGIWACEMGTGKTLAAIELIERVQPEGEVWYVGPKSGVTAVSRELIKWKCKYKPRMLTYEGLKKVINNWLDDKPAPQIVIFDESSRIKTPTAQRSIAAKHLADSIRQDWPDNGYIILMSGTPAPRTPVDWWMQCEIAYPGFITEGHINSFKARLCLTEQRESSITGQKYPHIITWWDNEAKCGNCGSAPGEPHGESCLMPSPSVNEVKKLYKRMEGLVLVQFKKDCLDLPDKQYIEQRITPNVETLRAAKLIVKATPRAATALILLRELSDGFLYRDVETGETSTCPACLGKGQISQANMVEDWDIDAPTPNVHVEAASMSTVACGYCGGEGKVAKLKKEPQYMPCPKEDALIEDLDAAEALGRCVVWGGFTGTIDRIITIAHKYGWCTLRVDGRGYCGEDEQGNPLDKDELLDAMDNSHPDAKSLANTYPKLCFVGHPKAGGMALTLTASPISIYYSNSFDGEARMQSEDRIHRAGMDANRGCVIKDYIHLATDKLVLDNLQQKRKLQALTMGEIGEALKEVN